MFIKKCFRTTNGDWISGKENNHINVQRWHNISHKHVVYNNTVYILNIHVIHFNFRIRLLEPEGVSSKQTYLGVVEQVITENDNYQQVARDNCGCVIMKVIVMKL